jgi:hypothetical protein
MNPFLLLLSDTLWYLLKMSSFTGSSTYFWLLYMNPVPLVSVVLGQPYSHLCQLPLVLLLLHQCSTTQWSRSGMFIRNSGCFRILFFFSSRIPDPTNEKEGGKNKLFVKPFLVAINCNLFNFLKHV